MLINLDNSMVALSEPPVQSDYEQKQIRHFFEMRVVKPFFSLVARPVTEEVHVANLSGAIDLATELDFINAEIIENFLSNIAYKPVNSLNAFEKEIIASNGYLNFLFMLDIYDKTIFDTVYYHAYDYVNSRFLAVNRNKRITSICFQPSVMPVDNLPMSCYGTSVDIIRFIYHAENHTVHVTIDDDELLIIPFVELMSYGRNSIGSPFNRV